MGGMVIVNLPSLPVYSNVYPAPNPAARAVTHEHADQFEVNNDYLWVYGKDEAEVVVYAPGQWTSARLS